MASNTLHKWKSLSLIEESKQLPNGKQIRHVTLHHPGAVVILPVDGNGSVVLLKQYRPSIGKWIYELPAGTIEPGEDVLECAKRELSEETDFQAAHWQSIGQIWPAPGFCDETQYLYFASQLSQAPGVLDDDEVLEVECKKPSDIETMIKNNQINDAKTIVAFYKARLLGLM
ncbi:NUDIX hydrolase [Parasalinivibrio latis]|uniref:NUDIX hydrolase n=1 Tax=Parasalinivibrio latis TaxID=2952610 RepID=UPI0030E4C58D